MADAPTLSAPNAQPAPTPDAGPMDALDAELSRLALQREQAESAAPRPASGEEEGDADGAEHDAAATDGAPADEAAEPDEHEPEDGPRLGRRRAAKEVTRLTNELTTAEQKVRDLEARLTRTQQANTEAIQTFVNLVGTDQEFEALRVKAEGGDWEAAQQVGVMRQWRQMAGPLYDAARSEVLKAFAADFRELRALEGMDDKSYRALVDATSPVEGHQRAYEIGKKAAEETSAAKIAALEARVSELQTRGAALGRQPSVGGGRTPSVSSSLASLLGPDGLPTEDAMARLTTGQVAPSLLRS